MLNFSNVDKVHDIMEEIAEQHDLGQEIIEAISKPNGFGGEEVDDAELERELDAMTQEDLDAALLSVGETKPTEVSRSDDEDKASPTTGPSKTNKPSDSNARASAFVTTKSQIILRT
jgi:hypothetical protein